MGMHNFRELRIWRRSMDFVERVYEISESFPNDERYGLRAQLRDCAISVPSNIAEGAGRGTNKQFRRFLEFAMGSINEVQTQLELAIRLKYLKGFESVGLVDEGLQIYKMILVFYNGLKED
ncbi:four helix bundle protein [Niabella sp. CC-SYL272]|uniref:four helix bundle protein n=1 Tax=Niabella agricola TaxID=2891571 RepID=UPI001F34A622|nr:four helix bundle protein [Niabella agricola]MCF3111842.1 four helix bundle protein [Niabella agricola]